MTWSGWWLYGGYRTNLVPRSSSRTMPSRWLRDTLWSTWRTLEYKWFHLPTMRAGVMVWSRMPSDTSRRRAIAYSYRVPVRTIYTDFGFGYFGNQCDGVCQGLYSSIQWAYGRQAELDEDQLRQQISLPVDRQQHEFLRLLRNRQEAEEVARKSKAAVVLGKLRNTSIRQPVRTFQMAEPVMIWRKFLPHHIYKGRKGGHRHTQRPRWVGPGRVVLHELLPGQDSEDRVQIVWVVLGNVLYRSSVHSVRPLRQREQLMFQDDSHKWKELRDMIPRRNYVDVTMEEAGGDELEGPHLPEQPASSTVIPPKVRFHAKGTMGPGGYPMTGEGEIEVPAVNDYEDEIDRLFQEHGIGDETGTAKDKEDEKFATMRRSSTSSKTPLLNKEEGDVDILREREDPPEPELPDSKRLKTDEEEKNDEKDDLVLDLNYLAVESGEGYIMSIELDFESNRQRKSFTRNPAAYLVKKVASSEVVYRRLNPEEKWLFDNAKASEVSSFISSEAVRRCLTWEEQQQAQQSDRVLKARWVLVWKPVPAEDQEMAKKDYEENPKTVHDNKGSRKAKARIVLLGFQHPDLLKSTFQSSAPVQSQLMRNLSLCLVAQREWILEGLDMKTAFLQTGADVMEQQELWTSGVPELKEALGASQEEVLRLLKNVYGNATAPRGLWQDVDKTFKKLGGRRVVGDASFWVWTEKNENPRNEGDEYTTIGFVGGHVDDFNRAGDLENPRWKEVRDLIDKAYAWGSRKTQSFRHTGLDLEVHQRGADRWISINQDYYVETIQDIGIPEQRLRGDPDSRLSVAEIAACRASLGALQWCATQTQLQICARVNLLLSELSAVSTIQVAKEIQDVIKEVRKETTEIKLWRLPEAHHWQDFTVVTLADQAHANRPCGGSTGGLITFLGGPQHLHGDVGKLNVVAWKTWKLRRKAISTNDGEIKQYWRARTWTSVRDSCGHNWMDAVLWMRTTCWIRPTRWFASYLVCWAPTVVAAMTRWTRMKDPSWGYQTPGVLFKRYNFENNYVMPKAVSFGFLVTGIWVTLWRRSVKRHVKEFHSSLGAVYGNLLLTRWSFKAKGKLDHRVAVPSNRWSSCRVWFLLISYSGTLIKKNFEPVQQIK